MSMELDAVLAELDRNRGYFPRPAVEEALRRREEITPHLLRALEDAAGEGEPPGDDQDGFLPIYALYLLAQFREQGAYPLVMDLCRLPGEGLHDLIGDTVTEGLAQVIASVFDGDMGPIASVIEDPTLDEYVRGAALHALSILAREGLVPYGEVVAYQKALFRGRLERESSHVWCALVSEAVDVYASELVEDIRCAYEEGLAWPGFISPRAVEATFSMPRDAALARTARHEPGLIVDVVAEMQHWACFRERPRGGPTPAQDRPPIPAGRNGAGAVVRREPKVGRNAPCPCGSGRKYKKCCGLTGRGPDADGEP